VFRKFDNHDSLFLLPLAPNGEAHALVANARISGLNAEISPDDHWIACDSDESGRRKIYVRPFATVDKGRWQISTEGGTDPLWARSGRELFFVTADKRMVVVSVSALRSTEGGFNYSKPKSLFDASSYLGSGVSRPFDIAADGKRFLMRRDVTSGNTAARPSIVVVSHWFDELKTRMQ
jgi:serine/threonine-protein kinase